MNKMTTVSIITGMLIPILILFFAWRNSEKKIKYQKKSLECYSKNYLRKQGCTSLYKIEDKGILLPDGRTMLDYHLLSFDGGKIWYAINNHEKFHYDRVIILGEVETVYPGLMRQLQAMDDLTDYVKNNGPIGSQKITKEIEEMIQTAGFLIK